MKNILTILFLLPCFLQAQTELTIGTAGLQQYAQTTLLDVVISRHETITIYDTIILFKGIDTIHNHEFVIESGINKPTLTLRVRDQSGLSEISTTEWICIICLKNFIVKVSQKRTDRFKEAKERLSKINP